MKIIFLFAFLLPLVAGDCPVPVTAECDAVSCPNAMGGPDCCPGYPTAVVNACYPEGAPCPELPTCDIQPTK